MRSDSVNATGTGRRPVPAASLSLMRACRVVSESCRIRCVRRIPSRTLCPSPIRFHPCPNRFRQIRFPSRIRCRSPFRRCLSRYRIQFRFRPCLIRFPSRSRPYRWTRLLCRRNQSRSPRLPHQCRLQFRYPSRCPCSPIRSQCLRSPCPNSRQHHRCGCGCCFPLRCSLSSGQKC